MEIKTPTTKQLALFKSYIRAGSLETASNEFGLNKESIRLTMKKVARFLLRHNGDNLIEIEKKTKRISTIYGYDVLFLAIAQSYEKSLSKKKQIKTLDALTPEELIENIRDVAAEITANYFSDGEFLKTLELMIRKAVREGMSDLTGRRISIKKLRKQQYEKRKSAMEASAKLHNASRLDNALGGSGLDQVPEKDNASGITNKRTQG